MANTVYGITRNGFNEKRLYDIKESLKTRLLKLKDPDTGETLQVNFDEDDPLIQIINAFADELSACWQMAKQNYNQFNPLLASDASLSGLVQLNGVVRKVGSPSTAILQFTGEPGVLVPKGTEVTDSNSEVTWVTSADAVIGQGSTVSISAYSSINGTFEYASGTINTLVNEITGVQAVVNTSDTIPGEADESDTELRLRRQKSTETPSAGIAESLFGAISNLTGVDYVKVYCNRELTTNEYGIPGKSVGIVVRGGDDTAIAKEIFTRASLACGFYGTTVVTFLDSMQIATSIAFSRPVEIPIDVSIVVSGIEGSEFPTDYASLIQNNIIKYAFGGPSALGIESGNNFDNFGFPPSENIVASRLYTPVNAVKGVKVVSLQIAKHGQTLGVADIDIAWNEVGAFTAGNISVTSEE